jgi:hypothetical protein
MDGINLGFRTQSRKHFNSLNCNNGLLSLKIAALKDASLRHVSQGKVQRLELSQVRAVLCL